MIRKIWNFFQKYQNVIKKIYKNLQNQIHLSDVLEKEI